MLRFRFLSSVGICLALCWSAFSQSFSSLSQLPQIPLGFVGKASSMTYSKDGLNLFTMGYKTVTSWDLSSFYDVATFDDSSEFLKKFAVSPDKKWIAALTLSPDSDTTLFIWNTESKKLTGKMPIKDQSAQMLEFLDNQTLIFHEGKINKLVYLNVKQMKVKKTYKLVGTSAILNHKKDRIIYYTQTGIMGVAVENQLAISNLEGKKLGSFGLCKSGIVQEYGDKPSVTVEDDIVAVTCIVDDKKNGGSKHRLELYNLKLGKIKYTFDECLGPYGYYESLTLSPYGRYMAASCHSGSEPRTEYVSLWDLSGMEPKQTKLEAKKSDALAFSPDGTTLAIGSENHVYFLKLDVPDRK